MLLANNFGAHYQVPSVHATYVTVGPGLVTNTYTIYFSYFTAFGWLGTALAMGLLGAVTTAVFRRAASGSPFFAMLFGVLAQRLVMSFHSEQFLIGINPFLKAVLFFALVFMVSWRRPSWSAADRKMDVSPA
jgi:oligosaccharide repeat unit polymerase